MKLVSQTFLALASCFLLVSGAQGALESRLGGQAVYDTDRDITWLADAHLAASNTFGVVIGGMAANGRMDWDTAHEFIAAMNADGGTGYLGFSDWRLPTTTQPDPGCTGTSPGGFGFFFNCTAGEMGHLFYNELGGTARIPVVDSGDPDLALFTNIQSQTYWTGTEFPPDTTTAFTFLFNNGLQSTLSKAQIVRVWPVRDGDVIPSVVAIDIDIKPGSDPNCFNVNGNGVIPVAILGSDTFDVLDIDTNALFFAGLEVRMRGKKGPLCHGEDSNVDGFLDLVCQFEDDPSMWTPDSSAEATLTGKANGSDFEGTDSICVTQEVEETCPDGQLPPCS